MLFHVTYRPKADYKHEDQKKGLELWKKFAIPEGYDIKSWHVAPDQTGFALLEAPTAELIYETLAPWACVYLDYEVVPVVEAETAIRALEKAIEYRESV